VRVRREDAARDRHRRRREARVRPGGEPAAPVDRERPAEDTGLALPRDRRLHAAVGLDVEVDPPRRPDERARLGEEAPDRIDVRLEGLDPERVKEPVPRVRLPPPLVRGPANPVKLPLLAHAGDELARLQLPEELRGDVPPADEGAPLRRDAPRHALVPRVPVEEEEVPPLDDTVEEPRLLRGGRNPGSVHGATSPARRAGPRRPPR